MNRDNELGLIRVKTLLWLLVFVAACYAAVQFIAPYFANGQLQDKMYEEARFAQANNRTPDQLRDIIYAEAQSHDIPLRREDIKVDMNPSRTVITADYTVTVDLRVHQVDLHFHTTSVR